MTTEFLIKLGRVRTMLSEEKLFGCYIKRQDNFSWLTCGGINYVSPGDIGNCGLLVTQDHLYAITNNIEAPRMKDEEKLEDLGFQIISGSWYDRNHEQNTLNLLCKNNSIGSDQAGHPNNLSSQLRLLRSSLTSEEVSRYQQGGFLVSRIIEETAASVRSGETEWAVAARVASRAWEEGLEPLSVFCSSDERIYNYRHAISTQKTIKEMVQLSCNIRYKGLVIGCTRLVSLKKLIKHSGNNIGIPLL